MYQIVTLQGGPDDPMGPIAFREVYKLVFLRKHKHVPNCYFPGGSQRPNGSNCLSRGLRTSISKKT